MITITIGFYCLLTLAVASRFAEVESVPFAFALFALAVAFGMAMLGIEREGRQLQHAQSYKLLYAVSGIVILIVFLADQFFTLNVFKETMALR